MRTCKAVLYLALIALAAFSPPAYAQEATLSGTITDSSGGVLPASPSTSSRADTGNTLVRRDRRAGRVPPADAGRRVPRDRGAPGFATITRTRLAARRADGRV